ncbi:biotin-dependent carboxyltransferase family protein [Pseudohalioglobus lutimaris]|uniref:Allophanate hydrolase n=1 Tax=Pseudohalioglobus lutimaris TaxID=1737061 RepID=A0A2N5X6L4_9GAMM|nr:biotin-dependent carboxyltransferase family protein [Pseudohalioglobus lutimaris]PLW70131.1 allophanate hydrolase [Pseudohalioglobus lutimaris]
MSLRVLQPGILSLLQDGGRQGKHRIGLTNGGPLDPQAFNCCNRLLQNPVGATALEISFGGVQLEAEVDTFICLTGAQMTLRINKQPQPCWETLRVRAGDNIAVEFAERGCRAYLGVAGGFDVPLSFGSSATVMREHIGGLNGGKIESGDRLPCSESNARRRLYLPEDLQPRYHDIVTVRVIPGYQQEQFNRYQQRRFFSHAYRVGDRCDRMGYRLEGPAIDCDLQGILSEGICFGAIQIPADGQPIVLLNDRQTIGGYPKIGSALSLDCGLLAQLRPGGTVYFTAITPHAAHNALHLAQSYFRRQPLMERTP